MYAFQQLLMMTYVRAGQVLSLQRSTNLVVLTINATGWPRFSFDGGFISYDPVMPFSPLQGTSALCR